MINLKNSELLKIQAFINGEWVESNQKFPVVNPFDGEIIAEVAEAGEAETKQAIESAHIAFNTWKKTTQPERAAILSAWAKLLEDNLDDLAKILTVEQGKPLSESRDEVNWSISHIKYCASETPAIFGEIRSIDANKQSVLVRHPFGVVAGITPWNFPILTAIEKTVYPIACGNSVVLKPSDETPLSTLALAYLADKAGLPPGVLNVVTAKNAIPVGNEMTTNPKVKMISFTGSTGVGKLLYKQAADTVKKVNLELGGNSPMIVFPDANIDAAAADGAALKFLNCGQVCVNINRFFIHESVYDEFLEKFTQHVKKIKMGSGLEESNNFGPLLNKMGIDKVDELVKNAVEKGAKVVLGGKRRPDIGELFYEPTILTNMNTAAEMYKNEIFGPVAPLYTFTDEQEVIDLANDTQFGLAAYFYTNDLTKAWQVSAALESANVCVNSVANYIGSPWGGHKESGISGGSGRLHTLEQYLESKAIAMTML